MDTTKKIVLDFLDKPKEEKQKKIKEVKTQKEQTKRIITTTDYWTNRIIPEDLLPENQEKYINFLHKNKDILLNRKNKQILIENGEQDRYNLYQLIIEHIQQKIRGYKNQDIVKNKYDPDNFVNIQTVLDLLVDSELKCHYCLEKVKIIYEHVREPKQWSLDRIDNKIGHICNNLMIACLSCNLKRRTMYHERYVFTKQLKISKIDDSIENI